MNETCGERAFAVTARFQQRWTLIFEEFGRLEDSARAATLAAAWPEAEGVAIWCRANGSQYHCVPWKVVLDVVATLALDAGGHLAAKYALMPRTADLPAPPIPEHRAKAQDRRHQGNASCWTYDRFDSARRSDVTFFEYDQQMPRSVVGCPEHGESYGE